MSKKKVEIQIPDDMTEMTAQECFLMGLKIYTQANNAGLCVAHGIERNNEIAMKLMSFRGEYAAAIMKFCDGVFFLQSKDMNDNLLSIKDNGSKILKELQDEGK